MFVCAKAKTKPESPLNGASAPQKVQFRCRLARFSLGVLGLAKPESPLNEERAPQKVAHMRLCTAYVAACFFFCEKKLGDLGFRVQGFGFRKQRILCGGALRTWLCVCKALRFKVYGLGFKVQGLGFKLQGLEFGVQNSRFRVEGLGFKVQVLSPGFRVQGLGFRVQGLGFRIWGLGFKVQG